MNTKTTLHYIHDPLCGWCYGAAPLVRAAREVVDVKAHAGGMMTGRRRQMVSPQLRAYVMPHDRRIAQLTGQPFGEPYFEGLLRDTSAVFDSEPPITAVLAADQLGGRALDLLSRLQTAHYVEGRRVSEQNVLIELAVSIGLEREPFVRAFDRISGAETQAHMVESRALLARVGGDGFPTFALEHDGRIFAVDVGPYFGNVAAWREWLALEVKSAAPAAVSPGETCGLDGC